MSVKALTFDIFGTIVDWRGALQREGRLLGVDGDDFALRWAQKYADFVRSVHSDQEWEPLDQVLRRAGREVMDELGMAAGEDYRQYVSGSWERLRPYADSAEGLRRLGEHFTVAALSNANTEMVETLARHGGYQWDRILGNELFQLYKPDRRVYVEAAVQLQLKPAEIMMVAAHLFDLKAARAVGYQTAFIRRAGEERDDPTQQLYVDVIADDLCDLAERLAEREHV